MKTYKCTYQNGDTIVSGFNGNLKDAEEYFLNKWFNIGIGEYDNMQKCIKVEQIEESV